MWTNRSIGIGQAPLRLGIIAFSFLFGKVLHGRVESHSSWWVPHGPVATRYHAFALGF
jgi:hypothetical protein